MIWLMLAFMSISAVCAGLAAYGRYTAYVEDQQRVLVLLRKCRKPLRLSELHYLQRPYLNERRLGWHLDKLAEKGYARCTAKGNPWKHCTELYYEAAR